MNRRRFLSLALVSSLSLLPSLLPQGAAGQSCGDQDKKEKEKKCNHDWGAEVTKVTKMKGIDCTITLTCKTCWKCKTTACETEYAGSECP